MRREKADAPNYRDWARVRELSPGAVPTVEGGKVVAIFGIPWNFSPEHE